MCAQHLALLQQASNEFAQAQFVQADHVALIFSPQVYCYEPEETILAFIVTRRRLSTSFLASSLRHGKPSTSFFGSRRHWNGKAFNKFSCQLVAPWKAFDKFFW